MVRYKPPVALLPFLKPGYGKLKRENKPQAKSPECLYLGPAPSHPRDAVRGLNKHRTLLFTRHVSWQRVTLASPVPAQVHDSLSREKEEPKADDESTSSLGGGEVMNVQDESLDRLIDLDVTWEG